MAGNYDPLHDLALMVAAATQTAGSQPRVIANPLQRLASRLGFDHRTDPSEIEDALRGTVERRVRREMAREVLALDEAESRLMRSGARNVGPYGDAVISLHKITQGEVLPERRWGDDIERGRTTMDSLLARYIPCPACGGQQAGPLHRTSSRLWQGRADRARRHEGVDPVSSVTLEDAERHLAAINKPPDAPYGC